MKKIILAITMAFSMAIHAQKTTDIEINPLIKGTLYAPETQTKKPVLVILIAGSGPTNRSGNQIGLHNNSLKYLAEGLSARGTYVFSYDKRIIAQAIAGTVDEKTLRFEHFITDAKDVIMHFRATKKYDKIIIAGHSEGSLIGMMVAQGNADAFISLAGAGRPIGEVIIDQISKQSPTAAEEARASIEKIKRNEVVEIKNPVLYGLFRKDVQPYLRSWMILDPQAEIKKLSIPVLIINGTEDLQVKVGEAELLKTAYPKAELHIIEHMNHLFKEIKGDDAENGASYNNPKLPVMPELITVMNDFIKKLK